MSSSATGNQGAAVGGQVREAGEARPAEVRPDGEAQLGELLARANRDGTACSVVGGSTKHEWGNRPIGFDLVVSTVRLRGFSDIDPDNLTLSVAAGTTVAEARAQAEAVDRILPLDPGHPGSATIGGTAATADQGARAAGYGGLRDVVLGVRATLADGSAVKFGGRTMKNVTGYDMTKLFVGSFGVLGVITEVTFRLLPRYATQALVILPLSSLEEAKASVARILTSYLQPLALEVVSADSLPPDFAGTAAKLPGGRRVAAPATAGAPAAHGRPLLLAGFGGHPAAVGRSLREVAEAHLGAAPWTLRDDDTEALYRHLADSGAGAETVGDAPHVADDGASGVPAGSAGGSPGAARFCLRASVPIGRALDLIIAAQKYASISGMAASYRAGAARGRVDLEFITDGAEADRKQRFADCLAEMRREVAGMGGSLFVTGGAALLPPGYDAWGDVGPALTLMKRIKEQFDPKGVLNPGRFVGGI